METVVQFLRRDAVLRKQVSGELDPRSPFMDLHLGLDAAGSSSGTNALGRHFGPPCTEGQNGLAEEIPNFCFCSRWCGA